jgi:hypothetical protein
MFLLRSHDPATYARPEDARPARATARPLMRDAEPLSPRVPVSTLSTSQAESEADRPEEDMTDEAFRAELRALRSSPEIPRRLSKRNARRLAAKGRLPVAHPPDGADAAEA